MKDDLDDLLDEVEQKFCCSVSSSIALDCGRVQGQVQNHRQSSYSQSQHTRETEDIDKLLKELDEDSSDFSQPKVDHLPEERRAQKTPLSQATGGRKCCPVFLGGSAVAKGIGTSLSQSTVPRACDQLRCTSCDFRVLMFDGQEWDGCDYLFLRNNMPDVQKLQARLRRRSGARAYACQCSWHSARGAEPLHCHSATGAEPLSCQPQLRWVCGKHLA